MRDLRLQFGVVLLAQFALPSEVPGYLLGVVRYPLFGYLAALATPSVRSRHSPSPPRGRGTFWRGGSLTNGTRQPDVDLVHHEADPFSRHRGS